ncbi:MAG: hypothetical protein LKCHEGNO_01677 [Burkholderiaceae bacterium]|nr:hypothetical protein [Burkholderiaceae bacterium]
MYAVPLASQKRYTLSSDGWSKLASNCASLTKLRRPSAKVSVDLSVRGNTFEPCVRAASVAGMYSLIATWRCSDVSHAR